MDCLVSPAANRPGRRETGNRKPRMQALPCQPHPGQAPIDSFLTLSLRLPYAPPRTLELVTAMHSLGQLRIDPGSLANQGASTEIELAIPYTDSFLAGAVLERAMALSEGLNARVSLVAVHAAPYPLEFGCPSSTHAFLVERLTELAGRCGLPVTAEVIMARSQEEGFRHAFHRSALVLVGSRKRLWRTPEEKLARALARDGRQVVLMHLE